MCGIVGAMPPCRLDLGWLGHRGPDASGTSTDGHVTFGHTRLSILEPSDRGLQPVWSDDGAVLLAFNGEIYNHLTLQGADPTSDTRSLLGWLARTGIGFPSGSLDGMYAFAAWFPKDRTLALARDPVGVKPLYLAISKDGECLAFASEIKGFYGIEWFEAKPNLDPSVQRQFLQNGYAVPGRVGLKLRGFASTVRLVPTLLERVWQVCPGQILMIGPSGVSERWCAIQAPAQDSDILASSVRSQMMSDVEVGVQLSGGIDSSLVAHAYASEGTKVRGFYVSVRHPGHDEDEWVRIAADAIGRAGQFELHTIEMTEESFLGSLDDVAWHLDEPAIRHPNAAGVYRLCEYVRRKTPVKVLLTGEGADEVFGGYSWHDGRTMEGYDRSRRIFNFGDLPELSPYLVFEGREALKAQLAYDRAVYLPPILARQDRMSMAHGIEARVPFLSNAFLTMQAPLVPGKQVLKRRAERFFGREFAHRAKCGFGFPIPWLIASDWDASDLDWLSIKVDPSTDFQRWTLSALARWSRLFLREGWRGRARPILPREIAVPLSPRPTMSSPTISTTTVRPLRLQEAILPPSTPDRVEPISRDGAMIVVKAGGNEWKLDPTMYVDGEILREGRFEWSSVRWLPQVVRKGDTVLDVGANFGFYTVLLSKIVGEDGQVVAFEPSERFRTRLQDHLARNRIRNAEVRAFGLSDTQERLELFGGGDSATLKWHDDAVAPSYTEWIELRPLDKVWPSLGLDRVDFLKVDIDGAEPFFFRGAEKTIRVHRPKMLVEFMEIALMRSGYSVRDLAHFLDSCGYLLVSEATGRSWTSAAAFLRDAANCSHSINVFALPRDESDPEYRTQHTWVASLPSIRRIGGDDSKSESAEERPAKTTLTTTAYWDADRGERFDPWVVNSSPYSEVLERVLPRRSDWTCAEIGAYPGGILCDLAKRFGYKPVAIEYSAHTDRIQRMFEHNGLSGIVENRDFLGIQESAVYDVVCSFGFVEHFADPREVVARHLRLTKPGGYVVLSVPRIDGFQGALYEATYLPDEWDRIRASHNPRAMNLDTLKRFASIAGDEIVFADYLFGASIYFPWNADFVRPEMRWLVRYLNDLDGTLRSAPSSAFHSPHALVIVRRGNSPVPEDERNLAEYARAQADLDAGRFNDGSRGFAACLERDQCWLEAWVGLGRSLLAEGRFEEVVQIVSICPLVLPESLPMSVIWAEALVMLRRPAEAVTILSEAQVWAPRDTNVSTGLKKAMVASGRHAAVERWNRFAPATKGHIL